MLLLLVALGVMNLKIKGVSLLSEHKVKSFTNNFEKTMQFKKCNLFRNEHMQCEQNVEALQIQGIDYSPFMETTEILHEIFDFKYNGTFIDADAGDGIQNSRTFFLER